MPPVLRVPVSRTAVTKFAAWAVAFLCTSEPYRVSSVNFIKNGIKTDSGGRHSSFLRKTQASWFDAHTSH